MRTFTNEERRARLATRHRLVPSAKATEVVDVARSLIGLHGTDPVSVFLAAMVRMKHTTAEHIEQALYEDRHIMRVLAMRRTLFVVPTDTVPVVQAAASNAIAAAERKRLLAWLKEADVASDPARWLRKVSAAALDALRDAGSATSAEMTKLVPELGRKLVIGRGKWQAEQTAASRVLLVLATEGHLARGKPLGSWISTQHRWEPIEKWLPGGIPQLDRDAARAELVSWWLRAFGPAPVADLKWWTGWTLGETRAAVGSVPVEEVELDSGPGIALADDLGRVRAPRPWVALLPSLDPTVMGWKERSWFLGEHAPNLFDRAGNAGPTVWWGGRVVGMWTQHDSGAIDWRLFEDVGKAAEQAVAKEADRVESWLGPVRFTPRFGPRWPAR